MGAGSWATHITGRLPLQEGRPSPRLASVQLPETPIPEQCGLGQGSPLLGPVSSQLSADRRLRVLLCNGLSGAGQRVLCGECPGRGWGPEPQPGAAGRRSGGLCPLCHDTFEQAQEGAVTSPSCVLSGAEAGFEPVARI